jgi:hypothetical protein
MCRIHREMLIRLCLLCPLLVGRLKSCSLSLSSSIFEVLINSHFPSTHSNVTLINLFFLASKIFDRFFFVAFFALQAILHFDWPRFRGSVFLAAGNSRISRREVVGDYQSTGNSADKLILCTFLL